MEGEPLPRKLTLQDSTTRRGKQRRELTTVASKEDVSSIVPINRGVARSIPNDRIHDTLNGIRRLGSLRYYDTGARQGHPRHSALGYNVESTPRSSWPCLHGLLALGSR
jgi:hypothetical protein